MASEPLHITKFDQSPLETKEMESGLSMSSSTITAQGNSSLTSAGTCIDDDSLLPPPTPSIQDNDADQETQSVHQQQQEHNQTMPQPLEPMLQSVTATDTPQLDMSQASIDSSAQSRHHDKEVPEQLQEEVEADGDQDQMVQHVTSADNTLGPALLLNPQEESLPDVLVEEGQPQQGNIEEDAPPALHLPAEEVEMEVPEEAFVAEGIVDGTNSHDRKQQQQEEEEEEKEGPDSDQQQQEPIEQGSTGLNNSNGDSKEENDEEHKQATTPRELERRNLTTTSCDEQTAREDEDGGLAPDNEANHEQDDNEPTPSPLQVPDSSTSIIRAGSDYTINHHDDPESYARVQIDDPEPVPSHLVEQYDDTISHHPQQFLQHEDHIQDDGSEHTVLDTQRVWEADRHAAECRRCSRRFNFLVRRHHCRRCGLVVCDRCSGHRIRLPPDEIIQDPAIDPDHYPLIAIYPQRVCDFCVRLPIKEVPSSSYAKRHSTAPVSMKRSGSTQSLMSECPVCGHDLLGMPKKDQEKHIQLCLNAGSPSTRPPRYLVYELSPTSPQINYECPICFEEFKAGERIARMICLCSYHRRCLSDWLERGKGCPVHYDPTL